MKRTYTTTEKAAMKNGLATLIVALRSLDPTLCDNDFRQLCWHINQSLRKLGNSGIKDVWGANTITAAEFRRKHGHVFLAM
jgi:hypothetical protein